MYICYQWFPLQQRKSEQGGEHIFPALPLMFLPKHEATGQNEIALRAIIPLYMVLAFTQVIIAD